MAGLRGTEGAPPGRRRCRFLPLRPPGDTTSPGYPKRSSHLPAVEGSIARTATAEAVVGTGGARRLSEPRRGGLGNQGTIPSHGKSFGNGTGGSYRGSSRGDSRGRGGREGRGSGFDQRTAAASPPDSRRGARRGEGGDRQGEGGEEERRRRSLSTDVDVLWRKADGRRTRQASSASKSRKRARTRDDASNDDVDSSDTDGRVGTPPGGESGGRPGGGGLERRDSSYDPDQFDPNAYDPGEVTVKREAAAGKPKSTAREAERKGVGVAGWRGGRARSDSASSSDASRSASLTRAEGKRRRRKSAGIWRINAGQRRFEVRGRRCAVDRRYVFSATFLSRFGRVQASWRDAASLVCSRLDDGTGGHRTRSVDRGQGCGDGVGDDWRRHETIGYVTPASVDVNVHLPPSRAHLHAAGFPPPSGGQAPTQQLEHQQHPRVDRQAPPPPPRPSQEQAAFSLPPPPAQFPQHHADQHTQPPVLNHQQQPPPLHSQPRGLEYHDHQHQHQHEQVPPPHIVLLPHPPPAQFFLPGR
ncbi:unnamed protein product [Scytosiphon promiscuus]